MPCLLPEKEPAPEAWDNRASGATAVIRASDMLASMVAAQPNCRQLTAFGFHLRRRLIIIAAVARSGE